MNADRPYNFIYEKLVQSDDDLIGLIAYGIYKQEKISFIQSFEQKYKRTPSDSDCDVFNLSTNNPLKLTKYREQAEDLISEMVLQTTDDQLKTIEKQLIERYDRELENTKNDYQQKIQSAVKANLPSDRKTFWMGYAASILATITFAAVAIFFLLYGKTSDGRSYNDTTEQVVNKVNVRAHKDSIR